MRLNRFFTACLFVLLSTTMSAAETLWTPAKICTEIDRVTKLHKLPRATFTRLIWTESRFDTKARSPVGAQGIAQFMPATAKERGLKDPYDPAQALEASASLLADLRAQFGNFGLAAMAYNAGPSRVRRWLSGKSGLPFETQDYVAAITGQGPGTFRKSAALVEDFALQKGKAFQQACVALPVIKTRFKGTSAPRMPWGVQVAGNFSRARAMRSWTRVRGKLQIAIGNAKPGLYRQRTPRGMRSKWAVRLGTGTRQQAMSVCQKIRRVGGFCLVKRNR